MTNILIAMCLFLFLGCGGGGGSTDEVPRNSTVSSNPDCDETHEVEAAAVDNTAPTDESDQVADDFTPGIVIPSVSKGVAYLQGQGYKVKKVVSYRNGKIVIDINTCGGNSNVNINSGNTTNPAPNVTQ